VWTGCGPEEGGAKSGSGGVALGRCRVGSRQRLIHDAADRTGTAAALGAAAKAAIDLAGRPRRGLTGRERATYVLVRKHVTRADNHGRQARRRLVRSETSNPRILTLQMKSIVYKNSNLCKLAWLLANPGLSSNSLADGETCRSSAGDQSNVDNRARLSGRCGIFALCVVTPMPAPRPQAGEPGRDVA
jgi:hypothetical protein